MALAHVVFAHPDPRGGEEDLTDITRIERVGEGLATTDEAGYVTLLDATIESIDFAAGEVSVARTSLRGGNGG